MASDGTDIHKNSLNIFQTSLHGGVPVPNGCTPWMAKISVGLLTERIIPACCLWPVYQS